jgi:hypothetical protein
VGTLNLSRFLGYLSLLDEWYELSPTSFLSKHSRSGKFTEYRRADKNEAMPELKARTWNPGTLLRRVTIGSFAINRLNWMDWIMF